MLWVPSILVLPLLALTVGSDSYATSLQTREYSQGEQDALPDCAQECINTLQTSRSCQVPNVCFCTTDIANAYNSCLLSQCAAVQDRLDGQRFHADTCNEPVRNQQSTLIGTTWALFSIALMFVILRLLSRWSGLNGSGYSWDDWVVLICFALVIPLNVSLDIAARDGLGQDMFSVSVKSIEDVLHWQYVLEILYTTVVTGSKVAIVLLYLRIWTADSITKAFRLACWIIIGVLVATAIAFDLGIIFQCSPVSDAWTYITRQTGGSCLDVKPMLIIFNVLNILYNVVVFTLPIHSMIKLRISWQKKLGYFVCTIFLLGLVVTICSVVRLQYLARVDLGNNVTWDLQNVGLWSMIEANLFIVCACAPAVAGMIQKWISGSHVSGSVVSQRVLRRRRSSASSRQPASPSEIPTEMTEQHDMHDFESALRSGKLDGLMEDGKVGDMDVKSIGSNTTDATERNKASGSAKLNKGPISNKEKATPESTALVYRPQPGQNNKVEISHEPPSQPSEAILSYRDEHDVYHEVIVTDIPHGKYPLHSQGKMRPSHLGALSEASFNHERGPAERSQVVSGDIGQASNAGSARESDSQHNGVVIPKTTSIDAPRGAAPPVSQVGFTPINGNFDGAAGSRRVSRFQSRPTSNTNRSVSLASATVEATQMAAKTPWPPTPSSPMSQSTRSLATQTSDTSLEDTNQQPEAYDKREEVVYSPRTPLSSGMPRKSPWGASDERSSSPRKGSVDQGIQVSPEESRSPASGRWEWPSDPELEDTRGRSPENTTSPPPEAENQRPFMAGPPSPPRAQSPPKLQSNIPQYAGMGIDRDFSRSPSVSPAPMSRDTGVGPSRSPSGSPPPDQYAGEAFVAPRASYQPPSPPLPTTAQPTTNPPSHEVVYAGRDGGRGRSPPRPNYEIEHGPRSASSGVLNSPALPTRDIGTETEDDTDRPRTLSPPREDDRLPGMSRTVSQLDLPAGAHSFEAGRSGSRQSDYSQFEGLARPMSREMLSPNMHRDNFRSPSAARSMSPLGYPNMAEVRQRFQAKQREASRSVSPVRYVDEGDRIGYGQTGMHRDEHPRFNMPLPTRDIDESKSPRTMSSQVIPVGRNRSVSPTTMQSGIPTHMEIREDMRPPLSKAGSAQSVGPPSPTAMQSGIMPDVNAIKPPSPPPMGSPPDIGSPRYESADMATSPMSGLSPMSGVSDGEEIMGVPSPRDISDKRTYSADMGTSPMSNFSEEGTDRIGDVRSPLDIDAEAYESADAGTSPMSDGDSATSPMSDGDSDDVPLMSPPDIDHPRSHSADAGTSPMSNLGSDEEERMPGIPSPADVEPRSASYDKGTSPMETDSPQSPLPGLASRSASVTSTEMSDAGLRIPTPHDPQTGPRTASGDLLRPKISPIQPMKRRSQDNTLPLSELPFGNREGRREFRQGPQPTQRKMSHVALPQGAAGIEDTFSASGSELPFAQHSFNDGRGFEENRPEPPSRAGSSQVALPMGASDIEDTWSPQQGHPTRLPSVPEEGPRSPYDMPSPTGIENDRDESPLSPNPFDGFSPGTYSRMRSVDLSHLDLPGRTDESYNALNFDAEERGFDQNYNQDYGHNYNQQQNDDWQPPLGGNDFEVPHIPSPLLAQLAGATAADIFQDSYVFPDAESPSSPARNIDGGFGGSDGSRSPQRDAERMIEEVAATVGREGHNSRSVSVVPDMMDGTDAVNTNPPRAYSAQLASLNPGSPGGFNGPPSARIEDALANAASQEGNTEEAAMKEVPSGFVSPDPYMASLAHLDPAQLRSFHGSPGPTGRQFLPFGPSSAVGSPENERQPDWNMTINDSTEPAQDRAISPPLPVVSPGLDDGNDTAPTTPGDFSVDASPLPSPAQGVSLSRASSRHNALPVASAGMNTPGSEFVPTRPVSQLVVPTLSRGYSGFDAPHEQILTLSAQDSSNDADVSEAPRTGDFDTGYDTTDADPASPEPDFPGQEVFHDAEVSPAPLMRPDSPTGLISGDVPEGYEARALSPPADALVVSLPSPSPGEEKGEVLKSPSNSAGVSYADASIDTALSPSPDQEQTPFSPATPGLEGARNGAMDDSSVDAGVDTAVSPSTEEEQLLSSTSDSDVEDNTSNAAASDESYVTTAVAAALSPSTENDIDAGLDTATSSSIEKDKLPFPGADSDVDDTVSKPIADASSSPSAEEDILPFSAANSDVEEPVINAVDESYERIGDDVALSPPTEKDQLPFSEADADVESNACEESSTEVGVDAALSPSAEKNQLPLSEADADVESNASEESSTEVGVDAALSPSAEKDQLPFSAPDSDAENIANKAAGNSPTDADIAAVLPPSIEKYQMPRTAVGSDVEATPSNAINVSYVDAAMDTAFSPSIEKERSPFSPATPGVEKVEYNTSPTQTEFQPTQTASDPIAEALLSQVPEAAESSMETPTNEKNTFIASADETNPQADAQPENSRSSSPAADFLNSMSLPATSPSDVTPVETPALSTRPSSYYSARASPYPRESRAMSPEMPEFATPALEYDPYRYISVSQLNVPTISQLNETTPRARTPMVPINLHSGSSARFSDSSLDSPDATRSQSDESSHTRSSVISLESDGFNSLNSPASVEDADATQPATPPSEQDTFPGIKGGFASTRNAWEAKAMSAKASVEKLRRPPPPMRTISQLASLDDSP